MGWPAHNINDGIFVNDNNDPGINLADDQFLKNQTFFVDKKIALSESGKSLISKIKNDYEIATWHLKEEKFIPDLFADLRNKITNKFKQDAWCLAWNDEQLQRFSELCDKADSIGLKQKAPVGEIIKNRADYIDNCNFLSATVLIHNSNSVFLEEAVRSGKISNPTGSRDLYDQAPRINEGSPNDGIFFVGVLPENLVKGAHWLNYSNSKQITTFPPKMLEKRGFDKNKLEQLPKHHELGELSACGMMIGIHDAFDSAICSNQPYLAQGDMSFNHFLGNLKKGEHILEEGFEGKAIALVAELKMHRQFTSRKPFPLHIDLSQNLGHNCPAIFYFPQSARNIERKKGLIKYFKSQNGKKMTKIEKAEFEENFEKNNYDFEKCAKMAGWGINKNGEFDEHLFQKQIDEHCIFYPDDVDLKEVYPWLVAIAAFKIRRYHNGGKKGLYFTYGPEKVNDQHHSGFSEQNHSYRIEGLLMDKMSWLPIE